MRTRARTFKLNAGTAIATLALLPAAALAEGSGGAPAPGSDPVISSSTSAMPNPGSQKGCSQGSGGTGVGSTCKSVHRYVNPFKGGGWSVSRIDMGVDYIPSRKKKVGAIGDAKILGSSMSSGWPGGAFIYYKLLNGDHAGDVIFVAEHLTGLAKAGTKVEAGERIATALPGDPWLEIGWATKDGQARAFPCYSEGMATNSGRQMARFLKSLGAKAPGKLSRGPDEPRGEAC